MKKLIALLLTLALAFTLAACGGSGSSAPEEDNSDVFGGELDGGFDIGVDGDPADSEPGDVGYDEPDTVPVDPELSQAIDAIYAIAPVNIMALTTMPLEIEDPSYAGYQLAQLNNELPPDIEAGAQSLSMIGQAYSLFALRLAQGADAQAVGQQLLDNIDRRVWVCYEPNKAAVLGSGDVLYYLLLDEGLLAESNLTFQDLVEAVATAAGSEDFRLVLEEIPLSADGALGSVGDFAVPVG